MMNNPNKLWTFLSLLFSLCARSSRAQSSGSVTFTLFPQNNEQQTQEPISDTVEVIINEISDKGTSNACRGHDWVELYNPSPSPASLSGFVLFDDKGITHEESFIFPEDAIIEPDGYLLLCCETNGGPQFGIGGDDTITLGQLPVDGSDSITVVGRSTFTIISSVGPLPDTHGDFNVTYARDPYTGDFSYTSTPTPGSQNVLSALLTEEEKIARHKALLTTQNARGTAFFGMDNQGRPVENAMPSVVDLRLTMDSAAFNDMMENATHKSYHGFQSAVLLDTNTSEQLWYRETPGRIRTKGQSTLFLGYCMGTQTIPFLIDLESDNEDDYLFGAERLYLRTHMSDSSYMRDWALHRMLARAGLPHLRARKVKFFINELYVGFYTLLEAEEQEYVFHRSFPDYDPNNYAMFKFKSFSKFCGAYSKKTLANAEVLLEEHGNTDPSSDQILDRPWLFERSENRPPVEALGATKYEQCLVDFFNDRDRTYVDVAAAWLQYDRDCGQMMVEEEIVDRDLGDGFKSDVTQMFNENFWYDEMCAPGCYGSGFADWIDVDQFLRLGAFYGALLVSDSPRDSFNNFYLANTGDGAGWKLIPYDFNNAGASICYSKVCNERYVHWSIARPTCGALEENKLFGPLLTRPDWHQKYLEYVRQFVDNIMSNEEFLQETQEHAAAIDQYVRPDFYANWGQFYDEELSPDAANWKEDWRFPLLPFLKARAEDVKNQLDAIDAGTFKRGPHVGSLGDNEALEICPDWRSEEADRSKCHKQCYYEGCHMEGYTIESFCDEYTSKCLHGNEDERCGGIRDGETYPGFVGDGSGRIQYCKFAAGVPVLVTECGAEGSWNVDVPEQQEASGGLVLVNGNVFESVVISTAVLFVGFLYLA